MSNYFSIQQIYERHRNGDANSTADLLRAATHFEELAWRADSAGPVFRLVANEARLVARVMREFLAARCEPPKRGGTKICSPSCATKERIAGCLYSCPRHP